MLQVIHEMGGPIRACITYVQENTVKPGTPYQNENHQQTVVYHSYQMKESQWNRVRVVLNPDNVACT